MNFFQKLIQKIWKVLYVVFPWIERHALIFHDEKRQRYHLGWLHPQKSLADLKIHLSEKWQFGNHFVAWEDTEQVLSWRKLISFNEQYHLRVYSDGEIRGHFELTPEASPIKHFLEKGEQEKREDFLNFLNGYIVFKRYNRHLEIDKTVPNLDSEITFADKNSA
ncbi:MAG: hypothetical protein Q7S32_01220 [bacterium]|nr:hypothetical protein [bacterium]